MTDNFLDDLAQAHGNARSCPSPTAVISFYETLLAVLFPDYGDVRLNSREEIEQSLNRLKQDWSKILQQRCKDLRKPEDEKPDQIFEKLPEIREKLLLDIEAMYEGDPAAISKLEVIKTYPGFKAIAAYRMANCIYRSGYPIIARIISEHAHSITGVDIHPAATIGRYFCIDHATGIVIGETTTIGNHVKIYQGVTLGATSVKKSFASKKRHPSIGNYVVIYANATILGGETYIGDHAVIGGSSWITKSVEPNTKLYYDSKNKHLENINKEN